MQGSEKLSTPEVIGILRNKVARNPGDLDSSLMLGSALYQAGDSQGSAEVLRASLARHPDHHQTLLLLARAEARSGDIPTALQSLAQAQRVAPENTQSWQVAAALAAEVRDWGELLRIGLGWTKVSADSVNAWQMLARAYFEESQFTAAQDAFSNVLKLEPDKAEHLISAARMAIAAQEYSQARAFLDSAEKLDPESADLLFACCRWYHLTGDLDTAEQYCRRAIEARPGYAPTYVELGILQQGHLEQAEIEAVNRMFLDSRVHPEHRCMLGFTLGDALDSRNEYAQAFQAWEQANVISRQLSEREGYVYKPAEFEAEFAQLEALFPESDEPICDHDSSSDPVPIFVLGMPRSGTTLVESILASHSRVYGAGELPGLYDIYEELLHECRSSGIESARELLRAEAGNWRERYLKALPQLGECDRVVDKQPLNFRCLPLIRLLFPDSPIFFMRRRAMDVGLSIYRHKFSKTWPCATSLADIGHYYGVHERMYWYWRKRYPDNLAAVDYHSLASNPESSIRELLDSAQLDFEPACLEPHLARRPVATFSSVQVQNPVSDRYTNRYTGYKEHLTPLRNALLAAGVELDVR